MCDDENEGDEGGDGGGGAPLAPKPSNRPQYLKVNGSRSTDAVDNLEADKDQFDEGSIPSLDQLNDPETLSNGYTLGRLGGKWVLFDDNDKFVGKYDTRENAMKKAFKLKPPESPSFGM